jgi:ubiquinone/menaquinone biosynthesis C-methylase UbiE
MPHPSRPGFPSAAHPARRWLACALALVVCALPAAPAAQLGSRPAEEWIKTLDGTTRVSALKIDEVVAAIGLRPGQVVADIGAGSGLLSVPMARAVGPAGKVYAVEIDAGFFAAIHRRAAEAGITNVETVLGKFTDPSLPVKNTDVALFHDVMHHIEGRAEYLKTLAPYLAPAGRIVVVDYEAGKGPHRADPALEAPRDQLVGWMQAIGFTVKDDVKLFAEKYVLVFGRK